MLNYIFFNLNEERKRTERNKDLRLLIKQLEITDRRVIKELREINKKLGNNEQKMSVMNRVMEIEQTIGLRVTTPHISDNLEIINPKPGQNN